MIWNNKMSIYTEFKKFSNIFFMYLMFDPYKALTLIINPPYKVDVDTLVYLSLCKVYRNIRRLKHFNRI